MLHNRLFCGFVCIFSIFLPVGSQKPNPEIIVDQLSVSEGLSNSVVNVISQDSYGFIWIGTDEGLNKYDGYSLTIYRSSNMDSMSLPNSFILSCFCDREGRLWIGTQRGICYYVPEDDGFVRVTDSVHVKQIIQDDNHHMIFNTNGTLLVLDAATGEYSPVTMTEGLHSNSVVSIQHFHDDVFLIYYPDRVSMFSMNGRREISSFPAERDEQIIQCSRLDPDGKVFVLTTKRVIGLQAGRTLEENISLQVEFPGKKGIYPQSILLDSENNLWIGTNDHLYSMNGQTGELTPVNIYIDKYIATKLNIKCISEDRYGNLWFGDYGNGVLLNPKFKNHFLHLEHNPFNPNSLSHAMVSSFAEDRDGKIWIGTWGGGLNIFEPSTHRVERYRFPDELLNSTIIRNLCFDGDNRLWMATENHGVIALDPGSGTYQHYRHDPDMPGSLPGDRIYTIASIREGEIWTGHPAGASIARFDPQT
ncbi:MAG: hypothetical protein EHM46_00515, partial [Bacteroidetes bacterium]